MKYIRTRISLIVMSSLLVLCFACKDEKKTYTNNIGMQFTLIPAGSFMMGVDESECPPDDPATKGNDTEYCIKSMTPKHRATITKPFYMGKHEVTQAQWEYVMGENPSYHNEAEVGENYKQYPVENVTWGDIHDFIAKLNAMEGGNKYRLPTEAEWEYACRAGSDELYYWGGSEQNADDHIWDKQGSKIIIHQAGQKGPNKWGLYDMSDNVWEYCQDWSGDYLSIPQTDPKGPGSGDRRVIRGGTSMTIYMQRCSARFSWPPETPGKFIGFRLVMEK